MNLYLLAAIRGHKRPQSRDSILADAMLRVTGEWGQSLPGVEMRKLDLAIAGRAWVDLTGVKALYAGGRLMGRHVNDIWHLSKDKEYVPGRGYEPWVWYSVREFLRVSGEGGRTLRTIVL